MNKLTLDEAIKIVEDFNIKNRFRDGGKVNNTIDELIKAAKDIKNIDIKSIDEISSMLVNEYTTGENLYKFIKTQMKFEEVINLFRLLKGEIDQSTKMYNSSSNTDYEAAVKIFNPMEYRRRE